MFSRYLVTMRFMILPMFTIPTIHAMGVRHSAFTFRIHFSLQFECAQCPS